MLTEYIDEALSRARYALIDDPDQPYYGEVPDLPGVWASGEILESCRRELKEAIEGWILLSVKKPLPIPRLGQAEIKEIQAEARPTGTCSGALSIFSGNALYSV